MVSSNATQKEVYERPKYVRLLFILLAILVFSSVMGVFEVKTPVVGIEGGEEITLQTGQTGKIYSLDGNSKSVNIESRTGVESARVTVEKYYTNELYISSSRRGKAAIGATPMQSEEMKLTGDGKVVELENKESKNMAIILTEVNSYNLSLLHPLYVVFIGLPTLLLILSGLLWFGNWVSFKLRGENIGFLT